MDKLAAPWQILHGDALSALRGMAAGSVHAAITSPPYFGLRAYAGDQAVDWPEVAFYPMPGLAAFMPPVVIPAQRAALGSEGDLLAYVGHLVAIFRACRRVLRDDGVLWLNLGDSYNSAPSNMQNGGVQRAGYKAGYDAIGRQDRQVADLKPKDLIGVPWRVALALQADGWYLRSDIIWHKLAPMPESVTDRPTKAHEYVFLLAKSPRYFYDAVAVAEVAVVGSNGSSFTSGYDLATKPGLGLGERAESSTRNRRSVWSLGPQPYAGAHFATWPPALVEPMILAGTSARGCCPACGAPWVRVVEKQGETKRQLMNSRGESMYASANGNALNYAGAHDLPERTILTLGWRPSCTCNAGDPIPCVVLDPFNGSGTTGAVAVGLGRDYIGIEIAADYIALAEQRIGGAQPALLPVGV